MSKGTATHWNTSLREVYVVFAEKRGYRKISGVDKSTEVEEILFAKRKEPCEPREPETVGFRWSVYVPPSPRNQLMFSNDFKITYD